MMRHEKIVKEIVERTVTEKTTCDMCGDEIRPEAYSAEEVQVRHRTGDSYPEGGYGTEVKPDICGKCFDGKLVPWLKSQGVEIKEEEWSW